MVTVIRSVKILRVDTNVHVQMVTDNLLILIGVRLSMVLIILVSTLKIAACANRKCAITEIQTTDQALFSRIHAGQSTTKNTDDAAKAHG